MPRNGFQLDLNLCTGCGACVVACAIENELPWGTSWRWVDTFNEERVPDIPVHHLSLACNHCADAPCMAACPAVAYRRDPVTGAVLLDPEKCIGCRYCTWACPYDAPRYDPSRGVVSKCTFCNSRQHQGFTPACASQCPTGALRVGPLDTLEGRPGAPGFPDTEARPAIRFVPRRPETGTEPPEPDAEGMYQVPESAGSPWPDQPDRPGAGPTFASEWPLWVFTLVVPILAGLMASEVGRAALPWPVFLGATLLAAGASTLHLGRKERAWRAILGWRTSWLSREIILFNAFAVAGTLVLAGVPSGWWAALTGGLLPRDTTGTVVAMLGFATLFAMDRVYHATRTPGIGHHSARTLLTGLLAAGVAAGSPPVWIPVLVLKLLLYGGRKHRLARTGRPWRRRLSAVRVGSALAGASLLAAGTPVSPLLMGPGPAPGLLAGGPFLTVLLGAGLLALGEAVDRGEFYQELEIPSPARQTRTDLITAVRSLEARRLGA
jgi:Fe-S-cluster-containing dehydrogenase component